MSGQRRLIGLPAAITIVVVLGVLLPSVPDAYAQQSSTHLPLPKFSRCAPATPPILPLRWRAVGLMAPFTNDQLDVGEFVYDGELPALRASVYGVESASVDLLITATESYQLLGPHGAPTGCALLGHKFAVPSRRWLTAQAQCVGNAPVMSRKCNGGKCRRRIRNPPGSGTRPARVCPGAA